MHIVFLTPEYPHERIGGSGGMGTSIKNLAEALVVLGVKVSIVVFGQKSNDYFTENDIQFHLLEQKKYSIGGFYFNRKHINRFLNKLIEKEQIDLIEAPDWTGITAFMKFRIPLVIRFHGSDTYFCHIEQRPQKWKNRFFEKNAVVNADGFIAPTRFAGSKSAELFKIEATRIKVIPYGLELNRFINEYPGTYEAFSLLNIGTLIRKKGVLQLAHMFNEIVTGFPQASLTLIGNDAPDVSTGAQSTWELMKNELSDVAINRVNYKGALPYITTQNEIKKAHLCIFPSFAETLGMVTIESMALQKAVINTNLGWAEDLIDDNVNGYLIDPLETERYVERVQHLFHYPDKVLEIGKAAREKVEKNFNVEMIAKENITYYQKILDQAS